MDDRTWILLTQFCVTGAVLAVLSPPFVVAFEGGHARLNVVATAVVCAAAVLATHRLAAAA